MQCDVIGIESDGYFCNCFRKGMQTGTDWKNQPERIVQ